MSMIWNPMTKREVSADGSIGRLLRFCAVNRISKFDLVKPPALPIDNGEPKWVRSAIDKLILNKDDYVDNYWVRQNPGMIESFTYLIYEPANRGDAYWGLGQMDYLPLVQVEDGLITDDTAFDAASLKDMMGATKIDNKMKQYNIKMIEQKVQDEQKAQDDYDWHDSKPDFLEMMGDYIAKKTGFVDVTSYVEASRPKVYTQI